MTNRHAARNCPGLSEIPVRDLLKCVSGTYRNCCPGLRETRSYRPEGDGRAIALVIVLSLVLHPAITWGLGTQVFDLTTAQLRSAVLTGAMAPGVNAYLFANSYGAAKRVAASSVLLATLISVLTIPVWLQMLP